MPRRYDRHRLPTYNVCVRCHGEEMTGEKEERQE